MAGQDVRERDREESTIRPDKTQMRQRLPCPGRADRQPCGPVGTHCASKPRRLCHTHGTIGCIIVYLTFLNRREVGGVRSENASPPSLWRRGYRRHFRCRLFHSNRWPGLTTKL